jgi:hypothetical protein
VPATALSYFQDDISRARALLSHAGTLPTRTDEERLLQSDLFRSAWMFAVGALDAYFCDAHTDIIAVALSSKNRQPTMVLPEFFYDIKVPVRAVLEEYNNDNWRWRMAARKLMERENVLSLQAIQKLFNRFLKDDKKFFKEVLHDWMSHADAKIRLFGHLRSSYLGLNEADRKTARRAALQKLDDRFAEIFQRRHDCIHNCDRPRMRPQDLKRGGTVLKVIQDIEFLVNRCDEHINREFRQFLVDANCNAATLAQSGY